MNGDRGANGGRGANRTRASLASSLAFLDVGVDAEVYRRRCLGVAAVVGVLTAIAASFTGPVVVAAPVGLLCAAVAGYGLALAPETLATLRRTRALGDAGRVVGRAALGLRLASAPERAAAFAARTGDDPLSTSLDDHVRRAAGTPRSGLRGFAREWSDRFPALERACALLEAAAAAPEDRREELVERAVRSVRAETRDRAASFSAEVRAPATGLYAFGVLLPLSLVAALPAVAAAGLPLSAGAVAAVYVGVLPAALVAGGVRLLVRRPVAFPPPPTADLPVSGGTVSRRATAVAVFCALLGWLVGNFLAGWAAPVAAVGAGAGGGLLAVGLPYERARRRVRAAEAGLADATALVGRRVADGASVERALARAGVDVPGETGRLLREAARRRRALGVGVRESFLGRDGTLDGVPSPRFEGAVALFEAAATRGRPAGATLVGYAEQLDSLKSVEREARRELSHVTRTLANTAALFGPLVAGTAVALSERLRTGVGDASGARGAVEAAEALGPEALGPVLGAYVLALAAILTALSAGMERGLDPSLLAYRVGVALPTATAAYLAGYVGGRLLA